MKKNNDVKHTNQDELDKSFEEDKKAARIKFFQLVLLLLIIILIIYAVSMAWFNNINSVNANSSNTTVSDVPFELATTGSIGWYDKYLNSSNSSITIDGKEYIKTSNSNSYSSWLLSSSSNLGNLTDNPIQPGSCGKLTFYVLPNEDNLGEVTFSLKLTPYTTTDVSESTTDSIKIPTSNDTYTFAAPLSENENKISYSLIKGHVLFFEKYNEGSQTYSGWLGTEPTLKKTIAGTEPFEITIYWRWPLQFSEFTTVGNGGIFNSSTNQADMPAIINDLKQGQNANYNHYLYRSAGALGDLSSISAGLSTTNSRTFSTYYNDADQYIGKNVRYIRLTLDAFQS